MAISCHFVFTYGNPGIKCVCYVLQLHPCTVHWCRTPTPSIYLERQGVVSLTFREFSKIISQKYTIPEITFSGDNFKLKLCTCAWLWAHVKSFSLKFSQEIRFLQYTNFKRIILESLQNVSETTPRRLHSCQIKCPSKEFLLLIWQSAVTLYLHMVTLALNVYAMCCNCILVQFIGAEHQPLQSTWRDRGLFH